MAGPPVPTRHPDTGLEDAGEGACPAVSLASSHRTPEHIFPPNLTTKAPPDVAHTATSTENFRSRIPDDLTKQPGPWALRPAGDKQLPPCLPAPAHALHGHVGKWLGLPLHS